MMHKTSQWLVVSKLPLAA